MAERILVPNLEKYLSNIENIDYVVRNHLIRYKYALTHLKPNWKVLDIACGSGYGSKMIAQKGCSVFGCDVSDEALDFSRKHNDHKLITWMKLDIQDICKKFSDSYFDAIVCFETLEHIEKGQEKLLSEFKKISKAGAPILTSVPYNHPDTKWHKRLFNFKQRDEMYKSIFSKYEYPKENASLVLAWNASDE